MGQQGAKTGGTRHERVDPRHGISGTTEQRRAAQAGRHARNGPGRQGGLADVGKTDRLLLQPGKVWRKAGKAILIKIRSLDGLKKKIHQIAARAGKDQSVDLGIGLGCFNATGRLRGKVGPREDCQIANGRVEGDRYQKGAEPCGDAKAMTRAFGTHLAGAGDHHPSQKGHHDTSGGQTDKSAIAVDCRPVQPGAQMKQEGLVQPRTGQTVANQIKPQQKQRDGHQKSRPCPGQTRPKGAADQHRAGNNHHKGDQTVGDHG